VSKKEKKREIVEFQHDVNLEIPEDEIWTYQVEGLAAPHIGKPYKAFTLKKIVFTLTIVTAVLISIYFSVRTIEKDTFEYKKTEIGYELAKFSNIGFITELDIDFVSTVEYEDGNPDPKTNYRIIKEKEKAVTSVFKFALNCDEKIQVVNIAETVEFIDPKAFYSCWALREIRVSENNPNYCSVDGVLYNKDKTRIICRPCDHDTYLAEKYGWAEFDDNGFRIEMEADNENYEQYKKDVLTYVIPSSVTVVGELCFNYSNMTTVYIPEGVKKIETLGFYKIPCLAEIYSYKCENEVTDPRFTGEEALGEVYKSLPETLVEIGSDAFTQCQNLTYVYIPESVTSIGHHAFWDTVYKQDGELRGVTKINVAKTKEDFKDTVKEGDQWLPKYDYKLFKKKITVEYSSERMT
jgi:hypothetical protein